MALAQAAVDSHIDGACVGGRSAGCEFAFFDPCEARFAAANPHLFYAEAVRRAADGVKEVFAFDRDRRSSKAAAVGFDAGDDGSVSFLAAREGAVEESVGTVGRA